MENLTPEEQTLLLETLEEAITNTREMEGDESHRIKQRVAMLVSTREKIFPTTRDSALDVLCSLL